MIGYLEGTVKKKLERNIFVQTNGVGYVVATPAPLFEKISEDDAVELYIHTRVREDEISLYGFTTPEDLTLFETVISISGVGPKTGLELLSNDPKKVKAAILNKDVAFLSQLHGIGKKTAERIIVELKNKIMPDGLEHVHQGLTQTSDEAFDAILALGYQKHEVNRVLKGMPDEIKDTEEIITYFLRHV